MIGFINAVYDLALGWSIAWCFLNTMHFVMRPLRLRRKWKQERKGVGK